MTGGAVIDTARKTCATFRPGAQNTTKQAGNLPDSEVFSRSEFMVLDVGIVYPQGRRHNLFCVLNPHIHPECLKSARDGFQFNKEHETMTASTLASRCAAPILPTTGNTPQIDLIALHVEAVNASAMATFYARKGNHAGAARKAVQALSAIRRLAAFERAEVAA